ncbi:MAG: trimethylamine methyltransferase family protein [Gemmatimonadota bacterium]|nr:MAG: trimethylamine methyltransferase family protein [Gemmatimonadota bacterium]
MTHAPLGGETPRSLPLRYRFDVLSGAELDDVHARTTELLHRIGVEVGSLEVLERLAEHGAEVDSEERRVRFAPEMVESAVARAPRRIALAARAPGWDLEIDGERGFLGLDGCGAEFIDPESGARRPSTKADVATITRLADALPQIAFVWQPVAARDVSPEVQPLHELHAQLAVTGKHIQMMTATSKETAEGVVEIARLAAGGEAALRERPIVSNFQCSTSPLVYDGGAVEAALIFGEAGVPCGFVVMPIACATGPATWGGTLVQSNAEALAGIVILETLVPGAPTFYGSCATVMDLRSGAAACGGPEDLLLQMASAQLARRYELPSSIGTFATGAKTPDWQAGLENGLSGLASALAGTDMLCGAGLLYGARVCSLEQVMLDAEIFELLCYLLGERADTKEDVLDVLEAAGPGGEFLSQRHTLDTMRRLWLPRLFDRSEWSEWESAGSPGPREAARARVSEIFDGHRAEYMDEEVDAEIRAVIERYEEEGGGGLDG